MVFGRPHRAILLCSQATGAAAVVAGGTYSIPEAFLTFGLSDSPPALRALTRRTYGDGRSEAAVHLDSIVPNFVR